MESGSFNFESLFILIVFVLIVELISIITISSRKSFIIEPSETFRLFKLKSYNSEIKDKYI
jgi:hypothetical protein